MKNNIFRIKFITIVGKFLFFLCYGLSRWKITGEQYINNAKKSKKPILICIWHGRSPFGAYYISKNWLPAKAIAGNHGDAEIMAQILLSWGFKLIRGSSSHGSKNVLEKMSSSFKKGETVCITNDGPRGPLHVAKQGSINIAMKNNCIIIPITGSSSRFWEFNSWDKFRLPKPFSTVYMNIGAPIEYSNETVELNTGALTVTKSLNKLQKKGDLCL